MATCEKCGKTYYTRECLNCKDKTNSEIKNQKKIKNKYLLIPISLIIIISILIYKIFFTNPLIGEWKTNTNNLMGINLGKIKFTKDKMIMMGIISKVNYEINGKTIYVTDETGTGMVFKMINNNTMYSETIGKIKYKKIK